MTNEELMPCPTPWCPASAPALMQGGFRNQSYIVRCETCQLATPRFYEARKAVATWNTRLNTNDAVDETAAALEAFRRVVETCEKDEAQGFRSKLRTYVLEMAKPHRAALSAMGKKS